jgi:DNA-binding SARP family transcriptional activator
VIEAGPMAETVTVHLQTFGRQTSLVVNGIPAQPRRYKVLELVAFLALHPEGVDRQQLQENLFPDSDQRRGGNHLRQIVHQLRHATGVPVIRTDDGRTQWPADVRVDTSDVRFERLLEQSNAVTGRDRLDRLVRALALVEGGPYLQDSDLKWIDSRRYELEVMVVDARLEAARLAFELDELEQARAFASDAIDLDPYAEPAYRILMQVEFALGGATEALRVLQRLRTALEDLGSEPAPSTVALLGNLRRACI